MADKEVLEEFFKEQLQTSGATNIYTDLFLYKDKQLLKENRLKEFAEHQIDKAKNIFWSVSFSVFIGTLYAFWYLIEFGMSWHWSDLAIGIGAWALLIFALIKACKEYYTITSSMTLFIKLLDQEEAADSKQEP
ncbi:hypothetical protein [Fodinibius sp. Rm-B-1B1-1]|uniref:hypothetical protein n=1 Tax=Fodinibius alkaliphilus TaxID=3140241 RepID=UPI00315A8731